MKSARLNWDGMFIFHFRICTVFIGWRFKNHNVVGHLDLIPAIIKSHGHCANKGLHPVDENSHRRTLICICTWWLTGSLMPGIAFAHFCRPVPENFVIGFRVKIVNPSQVLPGPQK